MTDAMINRIAQLPSSTFKVMTIDAAANMRKGISDSVVIDVHLRCLDDIINTCIQKALEQDTVVQAVSKCKELATVTHQSSLKTEIIRAAASADGG
jgi:hypothetical protein